MKKNKNRCQTVSSHLSQFHLKGRRVFVRIDGNVPLVNGIIANDYRLQAVLPTLNFIKQQGGISIVVTHMGRPEKPTEGLSTKILQLWFREHGFSVAFAPDIQTCYTMSMEKKTDLILLENIRFFPEEKEGSASFARELARLGDYYVNDAFASLHRTDTSMSLVAYEYPSCHRTIGFLVEKELHALAMLCNNPPQPFVIIMGGGKPDTKISIIEPLLGIAESILIYPALSFTFAKAQGKEVGASLVDDAHIPQVQKILHKAPSTSTKLIFPTDYQVMQKSRTGQLTIYSENNFPKDGSGIAIGPESLAHAEKIIQNAGSLFFNCAMGFPEHPTTLQSSFVLLRTIASSSAYTIIAGGNSVQLAFKSGLQEKFTMLSTGGGATLEYLAGKALPGLEPFLF